MPKPISKPKPEPALPAEPAPPKPVLEARGRWDEVLRDGHRAGLEALLPGFLKVQRWFGGKARSIASAAILHSIPVPAGPGEASITLVRVRYRAGEPERYVLPLAFASGPAAQALLRDHPQRVVAPLVIAARRIRGVLFDAAGLPALGRALLGLVARQDVCTGSRGALAGRAFPALHQAWPKMARSPQPRLARAEQSNSSLVFGRVFILKLFRRVESGPNPDIEVNGFLTQRRFPHVPPLAGCLEFQLKDGEILSAGMLSVFVPGAKDAWSHALEALDRFYDRVRRLPANPARAPMPAAPPRAMLGGFLAAARLLGRRTAQMHVALASDPKNRAFAPEPFTRSALRALCRSMAGLARRNLGLLRQHIDGLPRHIQPDAKRAASLEGAILQRARALMKTPAGGMRIRIHGDYHLGQVLYARGDFHLVDFEGEPGQPSRERRLKRSPLRDVAGMLRSFHYAAQTALRRQVEHGAIPPARLGRYETWGRAWARWVGDAFLEAYLGGAAAGSFLPGNAAALAALLEAELLHRALYELGYELNHRPGWLDIPLQAILQLTES